MADLKEQRYILEIAKQQSVGEAANKLYISQPALSRFLSNTEAELGVKLFKRVGRKMVPTYAGEQYIKYASQMIGLNNAFLEQISEIRTSRKGSLSIGSTAGRGKVIFSSIIPKFCEAFPEYELKVHLEIVSQLEKLLKSGILDIAFMTAEEDAPIDPAFVTEVVATEEIVLIASDKKKIHGAEKFGFRYPWVDIRQFRDETFLLLNEGTQLRKSEDRILRENGMNPRTMEFNSIDTIWKLIAQDFGLAIASEFNHEDNPDVNLFSIGSRAIRWKFIMTTRVGEYVSAPIKTIMDYTRQLYGEGR